MGMYRVLLEVCFMRGVLRVEKAVYTVIGVGKWEAADNALEKASRDGFTQARVLEVIDCA